MLRRAEKLRSSLDDVRVKDKVAKLRFPTPAPCGKTPLSGEELSKNYGSLEIFTDVSCVIDKGSRVVILGLNGAFIVRDHDYSALIFTECAQDFRA